MWSEELNIAIEAAIKAGKAIMEIYTNEIDLQVEYKKDNSPLTLADKKSNEIIVNKLKDNFPDYAILSEENKDTKERLYNDYCFIVDPLDGTKEFIKRNGQFTVNIALSYKHKSVMGVIYAPAKDELYYASQNNGAFYSASGQQMPTPLKVSDRLDNLRCVMSSSHHCEQMDNLINKYNIKDFIKMGSSLKGCVIAKGDAEIYYRYNPTMEWDTAAMQCIAEEAGGIFRQMDDTPMFYNRENSLNDKGFYIINCIENRIK